VTKRKKRETGSETGAHDRLKIEDLSPEEALRGFMKVDPEKVKEAERREERAKKRCERRKVDTPSSEEEEDG
jgi:hypothetical protein